MTALPLPPALRAAAAGLRALEAAAGLIIAQASCYILEAPAIPGPDSSIGVRLVARTGGGRVATALVTVCRLGHDASLIGQVSNDDIGRAITDPSVVDRGFCGSSSGGLRRWCGGSHGSAGAVAPPVAVAGYGLVAAPPARPGQSSPEPLGLRGWRLGEHQQPADFVGGEPDGDDAIAVTAGLPLFGPAAWRRAPARGPPARPGRRGRRRRASRG